MLIEQRDHEWRKAELRRRGTTIAQVARDLGITQGSLSLVSTGRHRSKRIERALADALGMTPETLFPDRYQTKSARRRHQS